MRVDVKEVEKVDLKNPVIVEGFPGIGMIGTISASFLAEHFKMKLIGCMTSPYFPPITSIHNYTPVSPARIYASEEHNLIVLFSEFVIPMELIYDLSEKLIIYAGSKNAKAIYSLAGIASPQPSEKIFGIASTRRIGEHLQAKGVELIKEGITQGVSGILIAQCAAANIDAANLLVQTASPLDPTASAKLLKKLGEIIDLKIDTTALEREGKRIQENIKKSMEKLKEMHESYEKFTENPMYG